MGLGAYDGEAVTDGRWTMSRLNLLAAAGLLGLVAVLGVVLFVSAGKTQNWQAWVYLATFFAVTGGITLDLARRDPGLLSRRVRAGPVAETDPRQRVIQSLAQVAFLAMFVLPGLDRRFGWSSVPVGIVALGEALVVGGLLGVFLVFRANSFTSATIEVAEAQPLITTGPYGLVRHPMYSAALVFLLGTPLALASWWGLLALGPMVLVIGWRAIEEERVLARELPGYVAYSARTRWRLLPGVF